MKKYQLENLHSSITNYRTVCRTTSAFGIPDKLTHALVTKLEKHKGLRNYLFFLLHNYRAILYSGKFQTGNGVKTRYQEEGQNLCYFDFKPFNGDWIELRMIALSYGVSMTQFFVFLLELDLSDSGQAYLKNTEGKVPTEFLERPIRLIINVARLYGNKQVRIKFGKKVYEIDENDPENYSMAWAKNE